MDLKIKRVYEEAEEKDGIRILVDRLWPRGVTKEKAKCDVWLKQVAPSPTLRKTFAHKPERFDAFREQYIQELRTDPEKGKPLAFIREKLVHETVTLVYASKETFYNHANVLKDFLECKKH
ncbi:DUF488 family protein [Pullulanibacillus sp. KACC 23026]|uniref:DUF488 domain-containing protein n=1 Tax=Pullulanibacillus sp. KACC 23026 TaxID=3028315 RepID=UPI0023AFC5BE|nr:DUF488 family protein [Pullulanibacillus sp. KACC 23026]WEG13175.1 DUF488 family protein [Pullulanibacillus sp. KACC 23026]